MKIPKIKAWVKKHKAISIAIAGAVIILSIFIYIKLHPASTTTQYVYGQVKKGNLVVSISGSGQVSTQSQVDIKPNTTGQAQSLGQIVSVRVNNGDMVYAGQVIAVLDGKNALQSLNQAKSSAEIAQVNYDKLVNGPTEQDLQTLKNSVQNGEIALENSKQNINIKLTNAYDSFSSLVYLNTDPFFQDPLNNNPYLYISNMTFNNGQLFLDIDSGRIDVGTALHDWKTNIDMSTSSDPIDSLNTALIILEKGRKLFDDMTIMLSSYSTAYGTAAQTALNTDKSIAASARSSTDSMISDLTSTLQSYKLAKISLEQNKTSLSLKTAPAATGDITVVKAQLDNSNANLQNAQTNYDSRIIIAPFSGQIGGLNAQIGQQVSSADSLGKIITAQKIVNISLNEVDTAKIMPNNDVILSFDALPGISMKGHVVFIDPLGAVSQGVVSYAVRVSLDDKNDAIKAGMTASAKIVTATHPDTIIIPTSAITTAGDGRKFVLIDNASSTMKNINATSSSFGTSSMMRHYRNSSSMNTFMIANPNLTRIEVIVGISNNSETEILSGLSVGQTIVIRTITDGSSAKSSASILTSKPVTRNTIRQTGGIE